MKIYQTIDFETDCKKDSTFLKRLEKAFPKFFEIWGELIENEMEKGYSHIVEEDYVIGIDCTTEEHYYVWFQARCEEQVIDGEGEMLI